jgi:GTPase involved in cell partitioning and DNA repair
LTFIGPAAYQSQAAKGEFMKSQLFRVAVLSFLSMVAGVVFVSAQDQSATMNDTHLTRSEVKALSMNAKTAQDHLKLAAYFRNEARQAEEMADLHKDMSDEYKADPVAGTTTELQMHCQEVADSARRASISANEMAKEQEAIAKQLQQSSTAEK